MAKKTGKGDKRITGKAIVIANDRKEAAEFIEEIGRNERAADAIVAECERKMATAQKHAVGALDAINSRTQELFDGLMVFATKNREELLPGGKKTVELGTGSMGWRTTPQAVKIVGVEGVIKRLKKLGLQEFIRTKETIDKTAMLRNPEKARSVTGVSITQDEEFFVKPTELKVEVTGRRRKIESKKKKGEEE